MARRIAGRRDLVRVLYKILANYDVIKKYMDDGDKRIIEDGIQCVEAELENFHEWGGDSSEIVILHFPPDSRQIRSMDRDDLMQIYKKYRFVPSESDVEETNRQVQHMLDLVRGLGYDLKE